MGSSCRKPRLIIPEEHEIPRFESQLQEPPISTFDEKTKEYTGARFYSIPVYYGDIYGLTGRLYPGNDWGIDTHVDMMVDALHRHLPDDWEPITDCIKISVYIRDNRYWLPYGIIIATNLTEEDRERAKHSDHIIKAIQDLFHIKREPAWYPAGPYEL
ncbi:hypothetical protein NMY22_g2929 [Coprinellus aureogranulatus]|nr:hypothetical protein NMY22_g2929 [Coprinellus aureogranulatus]